MEVCCDAKVVTINGTAAVDVGVAKTQFAEAW